MQHSTDKYHHLITSRFQNIQNVLTKRVKTPKGHCPGPWNALWLCSVEDTSNLNGRILFPCLLHGLLERIFNVNDKSVVHVVVLKPLECFVSIIDWNSLNHGCHTLFSTKIKHLLHLLHPTYRASSNCLQSCRSNYHMRKETSVFCYIHLQVKRFIGCISKATTNLICEHFASVQLPHGKS